MKLVAQLKLQPTPEQAALLDATLRQVNAASNWIAAQAWANQTFRQYDLHHLCYHPARAQFGLAAQATVRAIAKVVDAYKLGRKAQRAFRPTGGIAYDNRLLRYDLAARVVSIWTVAGRQTIPFVCGERQADYLTRQQGESDLCLTNGHYLLNATCEVTEAALAPASDLLGVDLGVAHLAVTNDGQMFTGAAVEAVRRRYHRTRKSLGHRMSRDHHRTTRRNARRAMRRIGHREQRFRRHVNHEISKQIVARAKDTGRGLAVEDLKGIRDRTRFRKGQRAKMGGWAFHQLRSFLSYKAQLHGVPLVTVDPRNTSRTCSECGHCEKANRPSQDCFKCLACGYTANADYNAACNIAAAGAAVSRPEGPEPQRLSIAA